MNLALSFWNTLTNKFTYIYKNIFILWKKTELQKIRGRVSTHCTGCVQSLFWCMYLVVKLGSAVKVFLQYIVKENYIYKTNSTKRLS